jgi:hypothetical protein
MSWSFWAYKKMETNNSPITFAIPEGWDEVNQWIEGKCEIAGDRAIQIFDNFIESFRNFRVVKEVINALKRQVPVKIPCEAYDEYQICSERVKGSSIRMYDPVSLVFEQEKTGEEEMSEENVMVQLFSGDSVGYLFTSEAEEITVGIKGDGAGTLQITLNSEVVSLAMNQPAEYSVNLKCAAGERQSLQLGCIDGSVRLDMLYLS